MKPISREQLQRKREAGEDFRLIEVLGEDSYEHFHLPGAVNVPLGEDFEQRIQRAVPDKEREVVVYCADASCPASPEAGKRMDALGYQHVLDYEAGKADWRRAGLPIEGERQSA